MLLDVSMAIKSQGEAFPFLHHEEIPPQIIFGETVTFDPVAMTGVCVMEGNTLTLEGRLETCAHGRCAACLKDVAYPVSVPFHESFHQMDRREALAARQEKEPSPLDEERLAFEGYRVDLSQLALTLAVLDLPMRFLCEPPCEERLALQEDDYPSRACQKELPDQHPFSALQQLLTKDQEV